MSRPFVRRPRIAIAPALLWLLVLAVCARALVPLGYMPDGAALRDGRLALTLCTASGPVPLVQEIHAASAAPVVHANEHAAHADAHAVHATAHAGHDHGDTDARAPSCPFWLAAHSFLFVSGAAPSPLTAQLLALPQAAWPAPPAIRPASPGPPLGSRAPPLLRT